MNFKLDRFACVFVSVALLAACRGEDAGTTEDSGSTGPASTTTGEDSTGNIPTTSDTNGTSTTTVDPDTTAPPQTETTDNTNAFITTNETTMDPTNTGPQPDGSACASDDECESMHCFMNVLSMGMGVCSECEVDQDCMDAGTGLSCTVDILSMSAVCKPGEQGNNCMSDEACMPPLVCGTVIDTGGLLPFDTCGECGDNGDCDMGQLCSPTLDMGSLSGSNTCVEPGSVPDGQLCPADMTDGDAACMSGHCSDVDIMGFIQIPVCGECEDDGDCAMGETCTPGMIDLQGGSLSGSTCG